MSSDQHYVTLAKSLVTDLKVLVYEEENWFVVADQDDIKVLRKEVADSAFHTFKMRGTINAPGHVVYSYVSDVAKRKLLDSNVLEFTNVKALDEGIHLTYQATASLAYMVSPRDVSLVRIVQQHEDHFVTAGKSIVSDLIPEKTDYVRADVLISGWLIKPTGPNSCEAHSVLSVDPKGWIPGWVVNTGGPGNSIKAFQTLKKLAEQHK